MLHRIVQLKVLSCIFVSFDSCVFVCLMYYSYVTITSIQVSYVLYACYKKVRCVMKIIFLWICNIYISNFISIVICIRKNDTFKD